MNLLQETIKSIREFGHFQDDIIFIGLEKSGSSCSWDEFAELANEEYYNGSGAQEVVGDLIIVFSNGDRMYRCQYDGEEWWNISRPLVIPTVKKPINSLFNDG